MLGVGLAGGMALLAATIGMFGGGLEWLAVSAGLGGVAFSAQQVVASIGDKEAKRRKLNSRARLIRRSLVETCRLSETTPHMHGWLDLIGNARSLDTIQDQFRELQDLSADLGGQLSDDADRAFEKFLRAADIINPLYARRATLPPDKDTLGERGQILERTLDAIDALEKIASPGDDEPGLPNGFRERAEGIALLYSPDE